MKRSIFIYATVVLLVSLGLWTLTSRGARRFSRAAVQNSAKEIELLSFWAPALKGMHHVVVQGRKCWMEAKEGAPIAGVQTTILNEFPRSEEYRAVVRNKRGRPAIQILSQPTKANNFALRIVIDDSRSPLEDTQRDRNDSPVMFEINACRTPPVQNNYNVVIITIDTLRADRLGCYGYTRPTSPHIDAFATQCVLFTNAFSTSSFTPPAHASLFTSRYVVDHGLVAWNALPENQITLAEVLKDYGFITIASVNLTLLSEQNLQQGFDFLKEGGDGGIRPLVLDGREIVSDGLKIVETPTRSPFFMWLHMYDVHRPYGRHPEWTRCFNTNGRDGVGDVEEHYNLEPHELSAVGLSDADLQYIADRYDAGIAYVDAKLRLLLDKLSTPDRVADTIVIITSDHGENLLDRRKCLFSHDPFLNTVVTRIPLLIRYPQARGRGQTCHALVSLIDIAPTVMEMVGVPCPASFQGLSLVPLLSHDSWDRQEVFMECWGEAVLKAVRSLERLIIHDYMLGETSFFNITEDPMERCPMTVPQNDVDNHLHTQLLQFMGLQSTTVDLPVLSHEMITKLRSLGYVE